MVMFLEIFLSMLSVSQCIRKRFLFESIVLLAERPEIQRGPDLLQRAVEGQNVLLPCETFGAPMPKVYWSKRDQVITGGR
jgi:hypothetical protein